MKALLLLCCLAATGCATSTVASRTREKQAVYEQLTPEFRTLVDQGQIRVGMPMDAVYIAWGPPEQVLEAENQSGRQTIWQYHGTWLQESRYWSYREVNLGGTPYLQRSLDHDYDPRDYVRAEIIFEHGVVKQWRTLPRPAY